MMKWDFNPGPSLEEPNEGHLLEPRVHPTADMRHAGIKTVMVWVCKLYKIMV